MKSMGLAMLMVLFTAAVGLPAFGEGERLATVAVYPVADFSFSDNSAFPPYGLKLAAEYWLPVIPLGVFDAFSTVQGVLDYLYRLGDYAQFSLQANGGVTLSSFNDFSSLGGYYFGGGLGTNIPFGSFFSVDGHVEGGYFIPAGWTNPSERMENHRFSWDRITPKF